MEQIVLIVHAASTWFMVGVIWLVQLGPYALFAYVGQQNFPDYYHRYTKAIGLIVMIPMFLELISGGLLFMLFQDSGSSGLILTGFILMVLIWCSTFFLQVPQHRILGGGFSEKAQQSLVRTNWIRTFLWTVRGFIVTVLLYTII